MPRIVAFTAFVAILTTWHLRVLGDLTVTAFACFVGLAALCWVYGAAIRILTRSMVSTSGAAFELVTGFFAVNTTLFILTLVTPLWIEGRVLVVCVGALALVPYVLRAAPDPPRDEASDWASIVCIVVCGTAATLWTGDFQPLMHTDGDTTVFSAWPDLFIHVREISAFAASHGASTISDIRFSGTAAPLYHVASYMVTGALSSLTHTSALDTFASFQLPFGILLSGLAAFVLARAVFGVWPGVVAAMAVVMLPDAYQQGGGIRLLSYHFMSQVNFATLYGIACVCIAWLFVFEGCRQQRLLPIACGYVVLLISLSYKAHIFVANAYLLLIYPCLFFTSVRARWRLLTYVVFTVVFAGAVVLSQRNDRVPLMRLDGSGLSAYAVELIGAADSGFLHDFFNNVLIVRKSSRLVAVACEALMIGLATFGIWLVVLPVVWWWQRKRWVAATLAFPVLVGANYFIMSLGLAMDTRGIGQPEELLNRPSAWAYFVVVVWSIAGLYQLTFGETLPSSVRSRAILGAVALLALFGVYAESRNLQTYPAWDSYATYADFNAMPTCYVKAAEYLRRNAKPDDIIQGDNGDPRFVLTALAERQAFVIDAAFGGTSVVRAQRLADLKRLALSANADAILDYMHQQGIAWYLMRAAPSPAAGSRPIDDAVFSCGDYRLLHAGLVGAQALR